MTLQLAGFSFQNFISSVHRPAPAWTSKADVPEDDILTIAITATIQHWQSQKSQQLIILPQCIQQSKGQSHLETLDQDGVVLDPIQLCPKLWAWANHLTLWCI